MIFKSKILSIQSHVVSGYVGNKCSILPLQILGNEVDSINSVQFSNHTRYEACTGMVLNSSDLKDIYSGLKLNNLAHYSYIVTGYIGSKTFLEEVCNIVEDIKMSNPSAKFYCDPVMGDNGKMYVPDELLDVYRNKVVPFADVLFPNQFEAEWITGIEIKNERDMLEAIEIIHKKGVKTVVVTSSNLGSPNELYGYASKLRKDGSNQCLRMEIRKFPHTFVGTGDLFAALFLGFSLQYPDDLEIVCSKCIGTMQVVLLKTIKKFEALKPTDLNSECYALELSLVDCISDFLNPPSSDRIVDINL